MKNETQPFQLEVNRDIPVGLCFSRVTNMYRLEDSNFQSKTIQIKLLDIGTPMQDKEKRLVRVLATGTIDLAKFFGKRRQLQTV